jgi:hypothetical protein
MAVDIGEIGEEILRGWCSKTGITCNKSDKDKKGWDFILQFENINAINENKDLDNSNISAFIQVKTTRNKNISVEIKLSNWDHLIKMPLPTFILYIVLDENNIEKEIYLTHIDKNIIEKILEKLRSNKNEIHKSKSRYFAKENDKLLSLNHELFKEKLISYIGDDFNKYCKEKLDLLKTLGYSDFKDEISITFKPDIDELVDFSIGLKEKIEISNAIIKKDLRFGIPEKIINLDKAYLSIKPNKKALGIKISKESFCTPIIPADFVIPVSFGNLVPEDKTKNRITSKICDIIFDKDVINFNFNFNLFEVEQNLLSLFPIARSVNIFSNIGTGINIEILDNDKIIFNYKIKDNINLNSTKEFLILCSMIDNLYFIYKYLELDLSEEINIDNLLCLEQRILEMRVIIDIEMQNNLIIEFYLKDEIKTRNVIFAKLIWIKINNKFIIFIAEYFGYPELISKENNNYKYKTNFNIKLNKKIITENPDNINLENEYDLIKEKYINNDNYTFIDYRKK